MQHNGKHNNDMFGNNMNTNKECMMDAYRSKEVYRVHCRLLTGAYNIIDLSQIDYIKSLENLE